MRYLGSMTRLARRKRIPMKVRERVKIRFDAHLQKVRGYECIVPRCATGEPIEACHARKGTGRNAMGRKPPDWWTFPACSYHHAQQHSIGEAAFELAHGVNLMDTATDLARRSKDPAVQEMAGVRLTGDHEAMTTATMERAGT